MKGDTEREIERKKTERGGGGYRETNRERERPTDRQTDRQTDRDRQRQRGCVFIPARKI